MISSGSTILLSDPLLDQSVETASQSLSLPLVESPERIQQVAPVVSPAATSDDFPVEPEEEQDSDVELEPDNWDPNCIVNNILRHETGDKHTRARMKYLQEKDEEIGKR